LLFLALGLLGRLAPGFLLGCLLLRCLFCSQLPGGLGAPGLLDLLLFDLLSLPTFLCGFLFCCLLLRRLLLGSTRSGFRLTLLLGGAGRFLRLLLLLLLAFQLLGLMPLRGCALGFAGDTLLGLGSGRTLRIQLHQGRLDDRLGRLEGRRGAEGYEQQYHHQQVQADRLYHRCGEAFAARVLVLDALVAHGASVIRPTLGTPDCCSAAIALTTTP